MEIEACLDYDRIDMNDVPVHGLWMGHQVRVITEREVPHLVKGYPIQGWGNVKDTIKPMNASANASGEVEFIYTWGDKDGDKWTVNGSVSVSDDKGNHVDVTVSKENDGQGSVGIRGGARTEEDQK